MAMRIEACTRCDGCGYVTGFNRSDWEIPWTRWVAGAAQPEQVERVGLLRPRPCPDCGGTGALILGGEAYRPSTSVPRRLASSLASETDGYPERAAGLASLARSRVVRGS